MPLPMGTSPGQLAAHADARRQQLARSRSRPAEIHASPQSLADVELRPSERALLLGMTNSGKSTLADRLIEHARGKWPNQSIIIYDSKPRWRASHELNGMPTTLRYRRWDDAKGVPLRHSVVISPGGDPRAQLRWAEQQHYQVVVAQIERHEDLAWLSDVMRAAYEHKRKNAFRLHVVDEGNHWFRERKRWGGVVIEVLTSGRENHHGMLIGGQRPRNISVEAIESCTQLYWFYTPYKNDVTHLKAMGVPETAGPGDLTEHSFYFFSRERHGRGLCRLPAPSAATRGGAQRAAGG